MRCFTSLALAGAFGALVATAAEAADMAFPPMVGSPAVSEHPVELGTGWYLRGDAGWSRDQAPLISSDGSLTSQPVATNGYSLDFGFGYKFNNWLRADLVYDYRKPQNSNATLAQIWCPYNLNGLSTQGSTPVELGYYADPKDTCSPQQSAMLSRQDVLLNGYIDLGTWGGVTPYIGAGAGFVRTQSSGSLNYYENANGTLYNADLTPTGTFPQIWVDAYGNPIAANPNCSQRCLQPQPNVSFTKQNWNTSAKSISYHLAWALMGGFAIDVTDHLKLDLGYRYVNFGTLTTTSASGATVKEKQSTQEIRTGFRYMID